jgi:asparagine synthetase B (glutamine-hydrolysing)
MIDKLLMNVIEKECPYSRVGVLLSGGVDSLSLAFAAHRLGKNVDAYTFHLEGDVSYDARKAQEACAEFGWGCRTVVIPQFSTEDLRVEFHQLINWYSCKKKTQLECTFPFVHVFPEIKVKHLLSGIGADGYYGVSKKAILHFKEPKEKFDEFRTKYFAAENVTGFRQLEQLANQYNRVLIHPYLYHQEIVDYFMQFDWYELNKPKQKQHVRDAFQEEFARLDKVKEHINLQLGSNIDHLFEKLLLDPVLNRNRRTRIMDLVSDYANRGQAVLPL